MDRSTTLKEFGEILHLSSETLRDRIEEGRLDAVYRGGNRDDPWSYRFLASNEAGLRFMQRGDPGCQDLHGPPLTWLHAVGPGMAGAVLFKQVTTGNLRAATG